MIFLFCLPPIISLSCYSDNLISYLVLWDTNIKLLKISLSQNVEGKVWEKLFCVRQNLIGKISLRKTLWQNKNWFAIKKESFESMSLLIMSLVFIGKADERATRKQVELMLFGLIPILITLLMIYFSGRTLHSRIEQHCVHKEILTFKSLNILK